MAWLILRWAMLLMYCVILVVMWRTRFSGRSSANPLVRSWTAGFVLIAVGGITYLIPRLLSLPEPWPLIGSGATVLCNFAALILIIRGFRRAPTPPK